MSVIRHVDNSRFLESRVSTKEERTWGTALIFGTRATRLANRVNRTSFETWLSPTKFFGVDDKDLVIAIPRPDFSCITEKWGPVISAIFEELQFQFEGVCLEVAG